MGTPNMEVAFVTASSLLGATVVQAGAPASAVQAALGAGAATLYAGAYSLDETLLLGSNTSVSMAPGTRLTSSGTNQHTLIRTGNAEFKADALSIPGVSIYCADEATTSGAGTLRYTSGTTSLAWLAPGESAYGSEIDISSVVSAATVGIFIIPGASSGKQLYVYVAPAARTTTTRTVRVEPVTGARAITWTRASNIRTVSETAHGRRIGDFVINFGPSADVSHGYITAVTADTYTFADTGSTQAVAQTGRAYGVRNVYIYGNGAVLDYNKPNLTTALMSQLHAVIFLACSDCGAFDLEINNATKYAIYATGIKNFRARGIRSFRVDSSTTAGNSDTVHITGPSIAVDVDGVRAQGGDNIVGIGCCDYVDYNFHLVANGSINVEQYRVGPIYGENTNQHPVRLYNANSGTISGGTIGPVGGTYSANADACVAVISDGSASQIDAGATNVTGLMVFGADAVRADGTPSAAFLSRGAGTRRGIRVERVRPRTFSDLSMGTVWVDAATMEDLFVEAVGSGSFAGSVVTLTSTAVVKSFRGIGSGLVWDNALGSGVRGSFMALNNASAALNFADIAVTGIDSSAGGSKAAIINSNNGALGPINIHDTRFQAGTDSLVRLTNGTATTIRLTNVEHEGSYLVACDVGFTMLDVTNVYHYNGASAAIQWNVGGASTARVRVNNLRASNRFLRNIQGNAVFILDALATELGTTLTVDAGTPTIRLGGPTDLSLDGVAATGFLDATVTNHAAAAGFYNTNAAFVSGVGAYVRGAAAWVRVAA